MNMGRLERRLDDDAIARAQLKLGRYEPPTKTTRPNPPRPAWTYRGQRRNAALGRYADTPDRNGRSMREMWPGVQTISVPYRTKKPRIKILHGVPVTALGKQPKVYAIKITGEDGVQRQYGEACVTSRRRFEKNERALFRFLRGSR
jgi:hypothetical protein